MAEMAYVKFNTTVESKAVNPTIIPIDNGQFLIITDTQKLMYDCEGKRIPLGDIIELETEEDRAALLTPLSKFYFVKQSRVLWRYQDGTWTRWPVSSSIHVKCTLLANSWNNGTQTVGVSGLQQNHNGLVAMAQNISAEQYRALVNGEIVVSGQNDNSLVFTAFGDVPKIDIPIVVTLIE